MKRQDIKESLKLAVTTLLAHKFRSALTILGVIVGTTTVIVVSSILTGMNERVAAVIEEFGTNTVYISRFSFGPRFGDLTPEERQRKPLSHDDAVAIKELPSVYAVSVSLYPNSDVPPVVKYGSTQAQQPNLRGVWASYLESRGYSIRAGRFFTQAENDHKAPVCVIGHNIASALFPNIEPLGKEIDIIGKKFRVIGVMEKTKASFGEERFEDSLVLIPYDIFRQFYPKQDDHVISVRSYSGKFDQMIDNLTELLRRRRKVPINAPDNFVINTSSSIIDQFKSITLVMGAVVVPISAIGLLVGGIGVMNIMLVSVTERTREIGIRRAIGARRTDIIAQFLIEAMMLTGMGGIFGIVAGELISLLINVAAPDIPSSVPLWSIGVGFSISVAIGLIFGMWPAMRASRLDPVEALRYE